MAEHNPVRYKVGSLKELDGQRGCGRRNPGEMTRIVYRLQLIAMESRTGRWSRQMRMAITTNGTPARRKTCISRIRVWMGLLFSGLFTASIVWGADASPERIRDAATRSIALLQSS